MNAARSKSLGFASLFCLALTPWILAQDEESAVSEETDTQIAEEVITEDEGDQASAAQEDIEEVVVTGSRLKRSTFESISPLQIVNAETSREAGLVDAAEIIQTSTTSADVQIDLTFSGYVLDNGPGASTANLRGLSPDRTLILLNGRRMAPGGVEGAPSSPDLNLIPSSLVSNYDFLLDGASSVYGSDAIAGVVNVRLRKDFNGWEFRGSRDRAEEFGTSSSDYSVTWGRNFSRGFVGAAATVSRSPLIRFSDAPFHQECETHYEIDTNGNIRTEDNYYINRFGVDAGSCVGSGITNIVYGVPQGIGTLYSTPGESNGGWQGFSESHLFLGGRILWFDGDGDGLNDVDFKNHWANGKQQYRTLYSRFDQTSYMTYGEYTFESDMNVTAFFEALYVNRKGESETAIPQLFPRVHPLYPFNPCNPVGHGVDCGLARDALLNNPTVVSTIESAFGCTVNTGGTCDLTSGPIGPVPLGIVVRVDGDRHQSQNDVGQTRWVAGVSADLPFVDYGPITGWSGEFSITYTSSQGVSSIAGIRDDRLQLAIGSMSAGGIPCSADAASPGQLQPDTAPGCVPVNLFAPSLWNPSLRGEFATEAERNYLFDTREFDTRVSQKLINLYLTGNVFNLPHGPVVAGIGYDHRVDTIDSIPNTVSSEGLLYGFSADQGAQGEKTTKESYAELELPLLANMDLAEELRLNVSARRTSDEYYGSHETYSAKIGYRPINPLLLRATRGTSYRSPNLRNSFLRQLTGFLNVFDPCVTPEDAFDEATDEYLPGEDRRDPLVLQNCEANGVDPRAFPNGGFNVYNVEVASGGALDLNPETSDSTSVGLVFEQPWTTAFDLTLGSSYYILKVDNTIVEPSAGFIVADCYSHPQGTSTFCSRITREADPDDPEISYIDQGFINRDNDTVVGIDYNVNFRDTVTLFDRPIEINIDWISHRLLERSTLFVNPTAEDDVQMDQNEWGYTRWRHTVTFAFDLGDWRFTYRPRYIGAQMQDPDGVDEFTNDILGDSDTCASPEDAAAGVFCRDIGQADSYINHTLGLRYGKYNWDVVFALQNVTDEAPPKIDGSEVFSRANRPLGQGYDYLGRSIFLGATYRFGEN